MADEQKHDIKHLLHRLNSADAGPAWAEFIDRHAQLLMKAVSQFEFEQDRCGECFLYVCEKLSDNGFRRLLRFNTAGKASFGSWLGAVVFNLCVDWHRKEFGRVQMLPAIGALPAFDRAVYRLSYEQALGREAVYQTLKSDFPDLTRQQLSDAMARVHRVLTPRQRWQIGVRLRRRRARDEVPDHLPSPGRAPEMVAQAHEARKTLSRAMQRLEPGQRLALHLRFRQGLTLQRIADMMRLGDPFRARRELETALDALAADMRRMERAKKS